MRGVSLLEAGHGQTGEYGFGDHTVLDMMMRLREHELSKARVLFIEHGRGQQLAVERAWQDVVAGYAELKYRSLKG